MKKTMMILVALVATLAITGCNNSPAQQQPAATTATASYEAVQVSTTTAAPSTTQSFTAEEPVIEEPVAEEPAAPAVEVEWQTLSYTWEDEAGYKFEATIKVSPWINTENSDYLNSAWNEVAQGNTLPRTNLKSWGLSHVGMYYTRMNDNYCEFKGVKNVTDLYYCVGEVSVTNVTEGWDITSSSPIISNGIWISACQPETDVKGTKKNPVYQDHHTKSSSIGKVYYGDQETNPTWVRIRPKYTANEWSAPFVFAHFENKTPATPEGEYISEIQDGYFCVNNSLAIWEKEMEELLSLKLSIVE